MVIKRVRVSNYKTYQSLDLDLSVREQQPIILIGGLNGGGKTTLFEAIYGALYGLKISNKDEFIDLLNDGTIDTAQPRIELEVTFTGYVLGIEQKYILKRIYIINQQGKPVESVQLNMNGTNFISGTAMPPAQRAKADQQINKIIKANLPEELSRYFLFDAMQSSELMKKNVFAQIIKDNIEKVMGFSKYIQLKRVSEKIQQEWAQQRLDAQKEAEEYNGLCEQKAQLMKALEDNAAAQDRLYKFLGDAKETYDKAKQGADNSAQIQRKIDDIANKLDSIANNAVTYTTNLKEFIDNIEESIFVPRLAQNISNEVGNILRVKEQIRKSSDNGYSLETIKDITDKVFEYLRDVELLALDINESVVAEYVSTHQDVGQTNDPYSYLDTSEVEVLGDVVRKKTSNPFIMLDRIRQDLEQQIVEIPNMTVQKRQLESSIVGGNENFIKEYEKSELELKRLKGEAVDINKQIQALEKRIHQYDVQIQQEPDVKYDTLTKLKPFFEEAVDELLKRKKNLIEVEMQLQLNTLLVSYKGCIARVEVSDSMQNFDIKLYHKAGNQISLNHLNAASKQIFIQVLLKVLRNLGDYNPPVMIDTVMGVIDEEGRDALMEDYFPQLAEQTILLCTTSEIRKNSDYKKLEPFISKTYTLIRDIDKQCTNVVDGYFGIALNN